MFVLQDQGGAFGNNADTAIPGHGPPPGLGTPKSSGINTVGGAATVSGTNGMNHVTTMSTSGAGLNSGTSSSGNLMDMADGVPGYPMVDGRPRTFE